MSLKTIKNGASLKPKREESSHKGQNGRVLVVSGSKDFHGAPILTGMGALYGGADLVYLYVPECIEDVVRTFSADFIVKSYKGDYLNMDATKEIIAFGKSCDSVVIGPGLSKERGVLTAVQEIIENLHIPTVLDADAINVLKKIRKFPLQQPLVATPHQAEFKGLIDRDVRISEDDTKSIVLLRSIAMDLNISIVLKGAVDYISSEEGYVELNRTGNSGMTVGGTGDVLAGLIGSFFSQGASSYEASRAAAFYNGKAGDYLHKERGAYYSASDLAKALPFVLK